ncbi:unnamed protein product, partial [Mycena citricolor]
MWRPVLSTMLMPRPHLRRSKNVAAACVTASEDGDPDINHAPFLPSPMQLAGYAPATSMSLFMLRLTPHPTSSHYCHMSLPPLPNICPEVVFPEFIVSLAPPISHKTFLARGANLSLHRCCCRLHYLLLSFFT